MNSPLIRRKKKSSNSNETHGEDNTVSKSQTNVKGEKEKNTRSLSNEKVLIEDDPYAFNLLMNDDSDSDEDSYESQESHQGPSSQYYKEGKGTYHNLETFQKRQLKQKVLSAIYHPIEINKKESII